MTSRSVLPEMSPEDRAAFGFARVRNSAYDAVQKLWRRRRDAGLTQQALADSIGMDPARLSKYLKGPGNWTLRTFGELVEGLDGEAEIWVFGLDEPIESRPNFHAYADYETAAVAVRVTQLAPAPTATTPSTATEQSELFKRLVKSLAPA